MKKLINHSSEILRAKFFLLILILLTAFTGSCYLNSPVPVKEDNTNMQARMPRTRKNSQSVGANVGWTFLDDKRKKLSDYQGKVVVLDFWATYCPPCVEGTPHLVSLQNQYGKDGLVVVGLNVGGDEDKPKIPDFIKQFKVQYEMAIPDAELVDFFMRDDSAIPQTIILDKEGKTVAHFRGFNKEIGAEIAQSVKTALAISVEKSKISH